MSSVDVNDSLASVNVILNLWAPVAFTFVEPVALSSKDVSSVEVTKVSVTDRPTLKSGVFVYLSYIKLCDSTSTKYPLM